MLTQPCNNILHGLGSVQGLYRTSPPFTHANMKSLSSGVMRIYLTHGPFESHRSLPMLRK